jgi:hypothetical protein
MATSRYSGEKSNKRAPAPIGLLLEEARDASAQAGGIVLDRQRWRSAVGERIASRTEPGRLRAGVLTVHAASAAWAQELTFLSPEIVLRVQGLGLPVKSLRFVVREAVGTATPRRAPARPVQKKPLPEELEARLASVADPELRAAIGEAASEWLARSPVSAKGRARAPRAAGERNDPTDRASRNSPGASRRRP